MKLLRKRYLIKVSLFPIFLVKCRIGSESLLDTLFISALATLRFKLLRVIFTFCQLPTKRKHDSRRHFHEAAVFIGYLSYWTSG